MISASLLTHPPTAPKPMMTRSETILRDLNVGTILNVSTEVQAGQEHHDMYRRLGIRYVELPIEDSAEKTPPREFIHQVLQVYGEHDESRAFLVNCSMGVNRSSWAAGAVLWSSSSPRPWSTPEDMVEYMRRVQREDRGVLLLTNPLFERELMHWCRGGSYAQPVEPRPIINQS
jgi:predicted protein tyrosine phosphatase